MDTKKLASTAISVVTPYLIEAEQPLSQGAGKKLWELINAPVTEDKDIEKLKLLVKYPDEKEIRDRARVALENGLEAHPELAEQLENYVKELPEVKNIPDRVLTEKQRQKKNPKPQDYSGKSVDPDNRSDRPHAD